jgi:hypothetical protein
MKIQGQIIDATDKSPVDGASITIVDDYFRPSGMGTIANEKGFFELDNENIYAYHLAIITYADNDYEEKIIPVGDANGMIELTRKQDDAMATVYVTAKRAAKRVQTLTTNNNWYKIAVAVTAVTAGFFMFRQFK